jgi:hypothetical protein
MSEQQLRIVRDHLELVLSKRTPVYRTPIVTVNLPKWETTSSATSAFPQGPKCGTCGVVCSEEGGTCKRCVRSKGHPAYCDGCGEQRPEEELSAITTDNIAGVVICNACMVEHTKQPILDVPLHLTC